MNVSWQFICRLFNFASLQTEASTSNELPIPKSIKRVICGSGVTRRGNTIHVDQTNKDANFCVLDNTGRAHLFVRNNDGWKYFFFRP